jgi:hypothetical protein
LNDAFVFRERDDDLARSTVLSGVVQPFLRDAIQAQRHIGIDVLRQHAVRERHGDADVLRGVAAQHVDGRDEP